MTITVTAAADYSSPSPAVAVTVSASPAVTVPVTVYRVHADGTEHPVIATAGNTRLVGGSWVEVDRHAPFNQAVTYRAVTASEEGTSGPWPVLSTSTWLIHPSDPDLAVLAGFVSAYSGRQFPGSADRIDVLGSSRPIHQTDRPRSMETGSVTVWCDTSAEWAALRALLADGGPLLLNTHLDEPDVTWLWIQPGDVTVTAPAPHRTESLAYREVTINFEGTRQPDVDTAPVWSFDDITALAQTFTQLATLYDTFEDMAFDRRTP